MSAPEDSSRLTLALLRSGGRALFAVTLRPVWALVIAVFLLLLLAAQVVAVVTYIQTLEKLRAYSRVMVEVTELRRQNASLLELDKELRDLLARQQQMLSLAGIETALRPGLATGDNTDELGPGSGGESTGYHLPALGETTRNFDTDHWGIDLGLPRRRAVSAVAWGRVTESGRDEVLGWRVVVKHNDSLHTVYANNDRNLVAEGDTVLAGDVLALVGSGAEGEEPHLHFEVWIHGEPVDPVSVLPDLTSP